MKIMGKDPKTNEGVTGISMGDFSDYGAKVSEHMSTYPVTKIKNPTFVPIEKDKSKLIMLDENDYFSPAELVVGESPSIAGVATAKAVAKLAAFMANKGTF